jgi:hypothetical protein
MSRKNTKKVEFQVYVRFRLAGSPSAGFNCVFEFETEESPLLAGPWL